MSAIAAYGSARPLTSSGDTRQMRRPVEMAVRGALVLGAQRRVGSRPRPTPASAASPSVSAGHRDGTGGLGDPHGVGRLAGQQRRRSMHRTAPARRSAGARVRVHRRSEHCGSNRPRSVRGTCRDPIGDRPREPEVVCHVRMLILDVSRSCSSSRRISPRTDGIQVRDRLVRDDHPGFQRERARDHHALALSARQLV